MLGGPRQGLEGVSARPGRPLEQAEPLSCWGHLRPPREALPAPPFPHPHPLWPGAQPGWGPGSGHSPWRPPRGSQEVPVTCTEAGRSSPRAQRDKRQDRLQPGPPVGFRRLGKVGQSRQLPARDPGKLRSPDASLGGHRAGCEATGGLWSTSPELASGCPFQRHRQSPTQADTCLSGAGQGPERGHQGFVGGGVLHRHV